HAAAAQTGQLAQGGKQLFGRNPQGNLPRPLTNIERLDLALLQCSDCAFAIISHQPALHTQPAVARACIMKGLHQPVTLSTSARVVSPRAAARMPSCLRVRIPSSLT